VLLRYHYIRHTRIVILQYHSIVSPLCLIVKMAWFVSNLTHCIKMGHAKMACIKTGHIVSRMTQLYRNGTGCPKMVHQKCTERVPPIVQHGQFWSKKQKHIFKTCYIKNQSINQQIQKQPIKGQMTQKEDQNTKNNESIKEFGTVTKNLNDNRSDVRMK